MQRRFFLKTSLTASAATAAGLSALAADKAPPPVSARDLYEFRAYRHKPGASTAALHAYLEKALIPALNKRGIRHVGVFTEADPRPDPKENPAVWVLIPHPSADSFVAVSAALNADPAVAAAGADYLQLPKAQPGFERIDSWVCLAFAGMPRYEIAAHSRDRVKTRLFELRTYESHSEARALKKIDMFNAGEIDVMREIGLAPVCFGQTIAGPGMPHLMYMTSGADPEAHKAHWKAFGTHPTWVALKNDKQYADTVSRITKRFLSPTEYSQI